MNVVVLNGSPKGPKSVTLRYVAYMAQQVPAHTLNIVHVAQRIRRLERDPAAFDAVMEAIQAADAVLWATPVYYLLVPAGYKRFIELVFEKNADAVFGGKPAAILTTSIRFFDHTAHNYLHAICDDLAMRHVGCFSADMYDLLKASERHRLEAFTALMVSEMEMRRQTHRQFPPLTGSGNPYTPGERPHPVDPGGRRVLLITDQLSQATNLGRMIQRMRACFSGGVETIDLSADGPQGDCKGCLRCADNNTCVYQGHDAFMDLYRNRIMKAEILILAGTTTDRYLSAHWKRFFDRSFFMGHVPTLRGKQIGLLVTGPLTQNANLRQILEAYVEMQQANLAGIATDEPASSKAIDGQVDALAQRLVACAEHGFIGSPTFLGHSGKALFRDEIWGRLRFPFRADYRTFRHLGRFDFPHQHRRSRLRNALLLFLSIFPPVRRQIQKRMTDEMIRPFGRYLKTPQWAGNDDH